MALIGETAAQRERRQRYRRRAPREAAGWNDGSDRLRLLHQLAEKTHQLRLQLEVVRAFKDAPNERRELSLERGAIRDRRAELRIAGRAQLREPPNRSLPSR